MKKLIFIFLVLLSNTLLAQNKNFITTKELTLLNNVLQDNVVRVLLTTNNDDSNTLRQKSLKVEIADPNLPLLIARLKSTVLDPNNTGVGIAAPQIGVLKRVFLIQRFDKPDEPFEVIINPIIEWKSNLIQNGKEGCLSIPDTMGIVDRHYSIAISYELPNGNVIKNEIIEGFTAIIFQHEYDHLEGILFIDRLKEQSQTDYYNTQQQFKYLTPTNTR